MLQVSAALVAELKPISLPPWFQDQHSSLGEAPRWPGQLEAWIECLLAVPTWVTLLAGGSQPWGLLNRT